MIVAMLDLIAKLTAAVTVPVKIGVGVPAVALMDPKSLIIPIGVSPVELSYFLALGPGCRSPFSVIARFALFAVVGF
jgi:hypothetical protein